MPDNDALPSVIEYSEDVATQPQPEPLPKGDYPAEIISTETKVSQTSGNTYVSQTMKVDASAYPATWTEGPAEGVVLYYNMILLEDTPKARFTLRRYVESAGLPPVARKLDHSQWIGRKVRVTVDHQKGRDGLPQAQITAVRK